MQNRNLKTSIAAGLLGIGLSLSPMMLSAKTILVLGDSISAGQWLTYLPIWLAVLVLIFEGFKHLVRQRRSV